MSACSWCACCGRARGPGELEAQVCGPSPQPLHRVVEEAPARVDHPLVGVHIRQRVVRQRVESELLAHVLEEVLLRPAGAQQACDLLHGMPGMGRDQGRLALVRPRPAPTAGSACAADRCGSPAARRRSIQKRISRTGQPVLSVAFRSATLPSSVTVPKGPGSGMLRCWNSFSGQRSACFRLRQLMTAMPRLRSAVNRGVLQPLRSNTRVSRGRSGSAPSRQPQRFQLRHNALADLRRHRSAHPPCARTAGELLPAGVSSSWSPPAGTASGGARTASAAVPCPCTPSHGRPRTAWRPRPDPLRPSLAPRPRARLPAAPDAPPTGAADAAACAGRDKRSRPSRQPHSPGWTVSSRATRRRRSRSRKASVSRTERTP